MEILVLIKKYLDGNLPYLAGVKIYQERGSSSTLKTLFRTEDDFSRKKLRSELQAIYNSLQVSSPEPETGYTSYSVSKKKGTIRVEILPEYLKVEYFKLSPIIREAAHLHSKLPLFQTNDERLETVREIIKLIRKRRQIFARCDHFMETGQDQIATVTEVSETMEKISFPQAMNKIRLLRSQRSKLKNKPHRQEDYKIVCKQIESLEKLISDAGSAV